MFAVSYSRLSQLVIPDYPILTEEHQSVNSNGREISTTI